MIDPRGILAAGAIAVAVTGAHAAYRAWPAVYGTEIHMPAALVRLPGDLGLVSVRLPVARLALDVPHVEAIPEPAEPVRRIGNWWIDGATTGANQRRLRGRQLYLQLAPAQPLWTGGPAEMRAATVSDAPIAGATNLAGIVTSATDDGYLRLDFSLGPIALPKDVAAGARAFTVEGARRSASGPSLPASDPGVVAILRVLPAGRTTLTGVIVNGARY